ncbi:alpha/beta hydrolase, partial [Actinospica durhamensis]
MPVDPRLAAAAADVAQPGEPASTSASASAPAADSTARRDALSDRQIATTGPAMDVREAVFDLAPEPVPVRIYRPRDGELPGLIYLHGGGFHGGGLDEADALCRRRAAAIGCVVVSVGYRLAPQHPFPQGLDDAWNAARLVAERARRLGIDPKRIAVGGQSAGANLAAVLTQRARDAGTPLFAAQLLEIPVTDADTDWPSVTAYGSGYGFDRTDLDSMWQQYLPEGAHRGDPAVSPLRGRLHGLPPALVTTVEYDVFRDQGERYAQALEQAAVPVHLRRWPGLVHGTTDLDILLPDLAHDYLTELAEVMREYLGLGLTAQAPHEPPPL